MSQNKFTTNNNPTAVAVSNADGETPVYLWADPATHALITSGGGSGGGGTQYVEGVTTTPRTGTLSLGVYNSSAPILTNGQVQGVQLDSSGNLKVAGSFSSTPTPDSTPVSQNITVQDTGSTTSTSLANNQSVRTGTPTVGSVATFALSSWKTVIIEVTGTWTGTLLIEGSRNGTSYYQKAVKQIGTSYIANNFINNFAGTVNVAALSQVAVRATAAFTGTAVVSVTESLSDNGIYIHNGLTIQDATIATNKLTVKSASTTAIATDPAVVVAISPNNSVAVTGTFFQTTQPISQATATNLNATVVGTGTFVTQSTLAAETTKVIGVVRNADGSGNLLTSTASALDINIKSGNPTSTTANQGTAAALTGGWPTINGEIGDVTGTFTNATQTTSVTANNLDGYGNTLISINGTYGTATAVFEGSDDGGTTWYAVQAARDNSNVIELGYTNLTNTNQTWQINNPGFDSLRVRSTAVTSGTVNVRLSSSAAPVASGTIVGIGLALPAGSAVIGHVIADSGSTTAVTQATGTNLHTVLDSGTLTTLTTLTGTTTLTPGTGATNLGKAEDAAHTTGDTGVLILGVRNDNAATTTTNANADYNQISTDGTGTVFVRQSPSNTPTLANVAGSVTTVTLLAANAARRTAIFYNDSASDCYVKYGATASTTSFTYYLPSLGTLSIDGNEYAGLVAGIWVSAVGNMRVTETSI